MLDIKPSYFDAKQPSRVIMCMVTFALGPLAGCADIFGSGFLNRFYNPAQQVQPNGQIPSITLDNAPGHVVVVFINNTRFDSRLLNYLEATGTQLGANPELLRPRVRVRMNVEYANGTLGTVEFVDGATIVEGPNAVNPGDQDSGPAILPPELDDLPLRNVVVVCDVAVVRPIQVEVFVPVTIRRIRVEEDENSIVTQFFVVNRPQYVVLDQDELDQNNNVVQLRNFDTREAPVPVGNVQCGAAVSFVVEGTLAVSFEGNVGGFGNFPSFFEGDLQAAAQNPGRFQFRTSVR